MISSYSGFIYKSRLFYASETGQSSNYIGPGQHLYGPASSLSYIIDTRKVTYLGAFAPRSLKCSPPVEHVPQSDKSLIDICPSASVVPIFAVGVLSCFLGYLLECGILDWRVFSQRLSRGY